MYQCLFSANDGSNNRIAANIPEREVNFLTQTLTDYFGYLHYSADIYSNKISAKADKDYGKYQPKSLLLEWLYENVFKYGYGFNSLDNFQKWYKKTLNETIENERVENVCIDILYDEYHTGTNTMSVWRKIRFYVMETMLDLNIPHPLKSQLRGYVKKAFINQMLEAN